MCYLQSNSSCRWSSRFTRPRCCRSGAPGGAPLCRGLALWGLVLCKANAEPGIVALWKAMRRRRAEVAAEILQQRVGCDLDADHRLGMRSRRVCWLRTIDHQGPDALFHGSAAEATYVEPMKLALGQQRRGSRERF